MILKSSLMTRELLSSLSIMALRVGMLAAKFLLSLFIARFMGLHDLGLYGLLTGAAAVGQVAMRFGIFSSLSRQAVDQPLPELTHHLRHYGTGCLAFYVLLAPFVGLIGWQCGRADIALLGLCVIALEHFCYDIFILTNNLHRPKLANVMMSLQSASWIYLFVAIAYFVPSLRTIDTVLMFWIAGGLTTLVVASLLTRGWPWREAFSVPLKRSWYGLNFKKSRHLYSSEVINMTAQYLDRYLITFFLGLELVGIYVLFAQVVNAICNLVDAGVLQLYKPRLIAAFRQGAPGAYRAVFRTAVARTMASAAGLALISAIIVPFLVGYTKQPLATHYLPLLWLMLFAMLFRIGDDLAGAALYSQHKDRLTLKTVVLKFALAWIVGALALGLIGIYGVVVTAITLSGASMLLTYTKWNDEATAA